MYLESPNGRGHLLRELCTRGTDGFPGDPAFLGKKLKRAGSTYEAGKEPSRNLDAILGPGALLGCSDVLAIAVLKDPPVSPRGKAVRNPKTNAVDPS